VLPNFYVGNWDRGCHGTHGCAGAEKIILVDDICTHGNTMAASIKALRAASVDADVVATTAVQMTIATAMPTIGPCSNRCRPYLGGDRGNGTAGR
jgi:hypothetical protein